MAPGLSAATEERGSAAREGAASPGAPERAGDTAERLLALGAAGSHPASAIAGVRTAAGTSIAEGGWARLPALGRPGEPMTRHTLLDLASVTKVAATTTLIMRLVADGQLLLQTPAHRFLPFFTGDGKDDITVEHLLTHTAGLPPWWPLYFEARYCEARGRNGALDRAQLLPLAGRARRGATPTSA